ncbi:MAG TPA: hypothetical protein PLW93_01625 [Candidatus Absconditabacterales bacterium]|nr:hypothetical protein [Candidatus Absconditabacterales bacterium]HNG96953.1 hypothetical protein [Candidatus Absconditabacterales bacterium]
MAVFFEVMKFIFFIITIMLGLFFARGKLIFDDDQFLLIQKIMMPGYMILCGMMIGYLVGSIWLSRQDDPVSTSNHIYAISLVFGLVLGVVLALINMFYVM